MFTGIVEKIGEVEKAARKSGSLFLWVAMPKNWQLKQGNSVAVDGVCLTVKKITKAFFLAELGVETLSRTTFGKRVPKIVNLERPLTLNSFLGGHIVLGHVGAISEIVKVETKGLSKNYFFSLPGKYSRLVIEKGPVAVDGVSLTVANRSKNKFSCSLVDYTLRNTTLGQKRTGDLVNVEFDIFAKYLLN